MLLKWQGRALIAGRLNIARAGRPNQPASRGRPTGAGSGKGVTCACAACRVILLREVIKHDGTDDCTFHLRTSSLVSDLPGEKTRFGVPRRTLRRQRPQHDG